MRLLVLPPHRDPTLAPDVPEGELLLLRAAQALLERGGGEERARLRAWGAVLTALSGPPSAVRLGLEGLGLAPDYPWEIYSPSSSSRSRSSRKRRSGPVRTSARARR